MLQYMKDFAPAAKEAVERIALTKVSRRTMLQGGAAFTLAAYATPADAFVKYEVGGTTMPRGLVYDPLVFVGIKKDGTVTITAHRSEMGTGSRTSLPMVVADEMEADWSRVKIIQAPGDEPTYGNQDTDGSRSMRHHIQSMRQIGASIRHMLAQAAAKEWGINSGDVKVENHKISAAGKTAGFGDFAEAAMKVDVPAFEDLAFKDEKDFRYIGKGEIQITDLRDITTGEAVYGADVSLPGMKYAVIQRPPVVGGKIKSKDDSAALKVPGVEAVIELAGATMPAKFAPLGGLAVIASNTWAAMQGRDALEIDWEDGPHGSYTSEAYSKQMEATAKKPGKVLRDQGNGTTRPRRRRRPSLAPTIRPTWPISRWSRPSPSPTYSDGKLEVWAPVQSPYGAREDIAKTLGIDIGRCHRQHHAVGRWFRAQVEMRLRHRSRAAIREGSARPSRVQWTREDDVRTASTTPPRWSTIEVALDDNDKVTGWRHNSVAPSILSTFAPDSGHQFFIENGMGHVDVPFDIPNLRCENGEAHGAYADRLVPRRLQHPARLRRSSPSSPNWPTSWARTSSTCCSR